MSLQSESLVISSEISCLTCEYKTTKLYDPAITYHEFVENKVAYSVLNVIPLVCQIHM